MLFATAGRAAANKREGMRKVSLLFAPTGHGMPTGNLVPELVVFLVVPTVLPEPVALVVVPVLMFLSEVLIPDGHDEEVLIPRWSPQP